MVHITSSVVQSGRLYACSNELVTYTCSAQGSGIRVRALPFINDGFSIGDPVSTTHVSNNAVLTLIGVVPVWSIQLDIFNATFSTNVTCWSIDDPSAAVTQLHSVSGEN